MLNDIVEDI